MVEMSAFYRDSEEEKFFSRICMFIEQGRVIIDKQNHNEN